MKQINFLKLISILVILSIGLIFSSCNKENDDEINLANLTGKIWKPVKTDKSLKSPVNFGACLYL